ncbi:class I SAM-dependent methyltransferase [Flavobacterium capsici]|uniref:Class I SAM-dependent methyltransferase n=1 Tax=Flavobacterium capsici TaxID=3075618 RepID=A0AA96F2T9_9FLAO|nr:MULTISPECIES: class I SAM-dependent methyltransferase [unclassified Flavobacterium]WNM20257.1 class I SAM-dependent methyltransferase [Flavobacterium sp. PMR2A8]WNM21647.1 class I SAM-dependent methyltransferase [Flavobacterium sp. PMTSA4]
MNINKLAQKTYYKFSFVEGNQHIANEYALKCILRIIEAFNVKDVLEIGIGIGCIADTVLEYSQNIKYTATEANEFCLNAIKENVSQIKRVELYSNLAEIPEDIFFDLIIIDGTDESLGKLKRLCKNETIIFLEGGRPIQVQILRSFFLKAFYTQMISYNKNPNYGPFSSEDWCGGGQLIFPNPNFKMKFFYWKERIATYIKRKYRKKK